MTTAQTGGWTPAELRAECRAGRFARPTAGVAPGRVVLQGTGAELLGSDLVRRAYLAL